MGLFSTNFSADRTEGIPFAPAPVGIALGAKVFAGVKEENYFGFSFFASWTFVRGDTNVLPSNDGGFGVKASTIGGLVDVLNLAYVGVSKVNDLRAGSQHSGFALVLGVGPRLIDELKRLGR